MNEKTQNNNITHNDNNDVNSAGTSSNILPALPCHCPYELSLTERSIKKLVKGSQFFPPQAGNPEWFHHRESVGEESIDDIIKGGGTSSEQMVHRTTHVTTLCEDEIRIGNILGRGGFCEVRLAHLDGDTSCACSNSTQQKQPYYAIKYLSPSIIKRKGKKAFSRGAADLAIEARFLSLLSHDNIIKLVSREPLYYYLFVLMHKLHIITHRFDQHYVSEGSFRENYNCLDSNENGIATIGDNNNFNLHHLGYFLVLDHLHETLDHRIKNTYIPEVASITGENPTTHHDYHYPHTHHFCDGTHHHLHHNVGCNQRRWLDNLVPQWIQNQASSSSSKNNDTTFQEMRSLLAKRLVILRSTASAVKYLHENHILFRDIKPDNIGFSYELGEEIPKLFDFGLVKELKASSRVTLSSCSGEAVYKLTGRTGSRRYMCPEVAFSHPYNYKADIYSFGVLLYEMATLCTPFEGYTIHTHETEILRRGCRPCLMGYNYWPSDLADLISFCWRGNMRERPNIDELIRRLDMCIHELMAPPPIVEQHQPMSARIMASVSQLQLSSSTRSQVQPSESNTTDDQYKGKHKLRSFFPAALSSPLSLRKNTAPQA